jgi:hypothetical protein
MVNLKAAALACGVVAACLGCGLGASYIDSSKVSSTDIVEEAVITTSENAVPLAAANTTSTAETEKATSTKKVTTSKETTTAKESTTAESTSEKSGNNESSTSEISTAVTTANATSAAKAAKVTVPAPVHAPVTEEPEIEPQTEAQTENVTANNVTTPESVTAPIPPSTEDLSQTTENEEPTSTATTAPAEGSGTTEVSNIGSGWSAITDEEYIILCNAVANEAGSDWTSVYDKARVVEVIMNRVNSQLFPNTIYGVLAQPYQFEGSYNYINLGVYSDKVTDSVKEAVDLYFSSPQSFSEGFLYFYGDGFQNYFS